ncbi:YciI family protein [Intrasporangium calvum]|uniref:YciI family protein n=1 Tax=Intrasporangium calvum TaxID=53358 RepID=A0ABT5GD71_9MICO|nr:YciI family protein [Intrasporangium calvum]MDC5696230.1 YciI family protein [Intrasporangium calvum]
MAIFAIHYTYPEDMTEALKVRPEHRAWLSGLPGLRAAGMYQSGHDEFSEGEETVEEPPNGALIVVEAASLADVLATFEEDPYWVGGHVLRRVVREWNPPLGPWVADVSQGNA